MTLSSCSLALGGLHNLQEVLLTASQGFLTDNQKVFLTHSMPLLTLAALLGPQIVLIISSKFSQAPEGLPELDE